MKYRLRVIDSPFVDPPNLYLVEVKRAWYTPWRRKEKFLTLHEAKARLWVLIAEERNGKKANTRPSTKGS